MKGGLLLAGHEGCATRHGKNNFFVDNLSFRGGFGAAA